jgi:protein-S-isoprenylcysteine O-methyltransferase Ste14
VILSVAIVLLRAALSSGVRRVRSRSPWQLASLVMVGAVIVLFWHPLPVDPPAWYDRVARPLGLAAMLAAGSLVTWAYVRLGPYWDGLISALPDHRIVQDGPFGLVRHPVYLGLSVYLAGGALLEADPVVGAVAVVTALVVALRAREEERFLEERLGDEYRAYARRVPMLLPRIRR